MLLELSYTLDDARSRSQKGNPIPLYAFQRQGITFTKGDVAQITSDKYQRFYAGFRVSSLDPNVIGLIVPLVNLQSPTLTMATGASVITVNQPVYMDMVSPSGFSTIDYGQYLANLYFIPLANLRI